MAARHVLLYVGVHNPYRAGSSLMASGLPGVLLLVLLFCAGAHPCAAGDVRSSAAV
jgi:hypothetical protein